MSEIKKKTITTRTRDYKLIDPQKNKKKYKNKISIKKKTKNVKDNPININKIPFGLKNNHKLNYNKLDINEKDLNSSISSRNKNNITSIDHSLYPVNQKINIKDFSILLQLKLNKNNNKKNKKKFKKPNKSTNKNHNFLQAYLNNNNYINLKNKKYVYLDEDESINKKKEIEIDTINSYSIGNISNNNTNLQSEMLRPFSFDSKQHIYNKNLITNNINNINFFISNDNLKEIYSPNNINNSNRIILNDINKGKTLNKLDEASYIKQDQTSIDNNISKTINTNSSHDIIKTKFNRHYVYNNYNLKSKNQLINRYIIKNNNNSKIKSKPNSIIKSCKSVSNYSIEFKKRKIEKNKVQRNHSVNFRNRQKKELKEVESTPVFISYNEMQKNKNKNLINIKNNKSGFENIKHIYKKEKENIPNIISKQSSANNKGKPTSFSKNEHKICINKNIDSNNVKKNNIKVERKANKKKEKIYFNNNKNNKIKIIKENDFNKFRKEENKNNNENEINNKLDNKSFNKDKDNKKEIDTTPISPMSLSNSISLRSKNFIPKKEYPNMAFSSSKKSKYEKTETSTLEKKIKNINSLCKVGTAGPNQKKLNQDNFFIFQNFLKNPSHSFLGVCDGHGIFGQNISGYLKEHLPNNVQEKFLINNIENISKSDVHLISQIINNIYQKTNREMNEDERIDSSYSGSTCVSVIFSPERLFCINVGDSRCVLGKFNESKNEWFAMDLSRDHKPSNPNEKERILKKGGKVEAYVDDDGNYVGPERVWMKNGDGPGLAMSRSFGDEIAHRVGVIINPEIYDYHFVEEDKFIILASDGIWEFISSEEVVQIIKSYYLKNDLEGGLERLYEESTKRWLNNENIVDDITIIIAFLE